MSQPHRRLFNPHGNTSNSRLRHPGQNPRGLPQQQLQHQRQHGPPPLPLFTQRQPPSNNAFIRHNVGHPQHYGQRPYLHPYQFPPGHDDPQCIPLSGPRSQHVVPQSGIYPRFAFGPHHNKARYWTGTSDQNVQHEFKNGKTQGGYGSLHQTSHPESLVVNSVPGPSQASLPEAQPLASALGESRPSELSGHRDGSQHRTLRSLLESPEMPVNLQYGPLSCDTIFQQLPQLQPLSVPPTQEQQNKTEAQPQQQHIWTDLSTKHLQQSKEKNKAGSKLTQIDNSELRSAECNKKRRKKQDPKANNQVTNVSKVSPEENVVQERKILTKKMREFTLKKFPDLRNKTYSVPPVRSNKTKYTRLDKLSTSSHDVMEQRETQAGSLLGEQTEDIVTKFVEEIVESVNEPMFVLFNYQFDDYLFHLDKKMSISDNAQTKLQSVQFTDHEQNCSGNTGRKVDEQQSAPSDSETVMNAIDNRQRNEGHIPADTVDIHRSEKQLQPEAKAGERKAPVRKNLGADLFESSPESTRKPSVFKGLFPTPRDLDTSIRRGDFDGLIVSPKHGFVVFEAKTMRGREDNQPQGEVPGEKETKSVQEGLSEEPAKLSVCRNKTDADAEADQTVTQIISGGNAEFQPELDQLKNAFQNAGLAEGPDHQFKHPKNYPNSEYQMSESTLNAESQLEVLEVYNESECQTTQCEFIKESQPAYPVHASKYPGGIEIHWDTEQKSDSSSSTDTANPLLPPKGNQSESANPSGSNASQDTDFKKTIRKGLKQLEKAERVLRHLASDLEEVPDVTKVLALPNTPTADVRRLLEDSVLSKECCDILQTETREEAVSRCITSDAVHQPSAATDDTVSGDTTLGSLRPALQWWLALVQSLANKRKTTKKEREHDKGSLDEESEEMMALSWDFYEQLVARFCGLYSRVKTRTVADCVHLTGVAFGRSILRDDQLRLLSSEAPFLFITGPPGSGKTLLLALKAAEWAQNGDQVVIVCVDGVNSGSLISWTVHSRVAEAMEDFKVREMMKMKKKKTPKSFDEGQKSAERQKSHRDQRRKKANQNKSESKNTQNTLIVSQSQKASYAAPTTKTQDSTSKSESSQLKSESINFCSSESADHRSFQDNPVTAGKETASNVQLARISNATDMDKFLVDLMTKNVDTNLRIIVDECLRHYSEEYVYNRFTVAQDTLEEMNKLYSDILSRVTSDTTDRVGLCSDTKASEQECLTEGIPLKRFQQEEAERNNSKADHLSKCREEENVERKISLKVSSTAIPEDLNDEAQQDEDSEKTFSIASATLEGQQDKGTKQNMLTEKSATYKSSNQNLQHNSSLKGENLHNSKEDTPSKASPYPGLQSADYFLTMDDRMDKLGNRLRLLQADSSSGPRLMHSAKWRDTVTLLSMTYQSVNTLKTQAARCILRSASCDKAVIEILEEPSRLVVSVMGELFLVYNSLTFFQLDQFFATALTAARETRLAPGQSLSVWGSSIYPGYTPPGYERQTLTHSIRCPPTVQRILQWTEADTKDPPGYSYITRGCDVNPPLPSDGPPVIWIDHSPHLTSYSEVNDCAACGKTLADYLLKTLGLHDSAAKNSTGKYKKGQSQVDKLYLHDVIICGSPIHQPDCAFLQELTHAAIPVQWESQQLKSPPPYTDKAFLVGGSTVQGLEAKVVVFVPELKRITEKEKLTTSPAASVSASVKSVVQTCKRAQGQSQTQCEGQGQNRGDIWPEHTEEGDEQRVSSHDRDRIEQDRLRRLGSWNRQYLWQVASRTLAHLIVFHV